MRILIGGIGYTNLRDMSVGPFVIDRLKKFIIPEGVEVEDLNHLVAAYQRVSQEKYDRLILVAAVRRGKEPGTVTAYRIGEDAALPDQDEIRLRVSEGVAGTVDLDSLLILCRYYGALPADVLVIEVEPEDEDWGDAFTPRVKSAIEVVIERIQDEAGLHRQEETNRV